MAEQKLNKMHWAVILTLGTAFAASAYFNTPQKNAQPRLPQPTVPEPE